MRDYPAVGIPHHLIVDPRNGTCLHAYQIETIEGRPAYSIQIPYKYGDIVPIGDWTIETADLPR
jgi:hypothetical protein